MSNVAYIAPYYKFKPFSRNLYKSASRLSKLLLFI